MSSSPAKTTANVLFDIEFEINGYKLNGAYSPTMGILAGRVEDINLKQLAPTDMAEFIPDISIEQVEAAYNLNNHSSYLKTQLGLDLSLHDIPLLGPRIPAADTFSLSDLRIVISHKQGKTQLSLDGDLSILNFKLPLALPLTKDTVTMSTGAGSDSQHSAHNQSTEAATQSKQPVVIREKTQQGMVKWFDVNKTIGPGELKRIGLQFIDGTLFFLLDMQMAMGPLTIGFDGLAVGSPIDKLDPQFKLSGMSVSYSKGPTSITGAFLYDEIDDSYQGLAMIKVPSFSIAALGAYKELNGQPSLFIYGVLDLAVGAGPPFLQITGVSAGFGYNRTLNVPDVSKVSEFPLVSAAMGQDLGKEPLAVLSRIKTYIPAASGELFVAFGLKFSSFKLIEAFALLLLRLGNRTKLDILGLARVSVPNKVDNPLAVAELALKASYDFEEKSLKIAAELTPSSYILSPKCRLTGGFAFYSWFEGEHAGDVVLTMGGYHPDFKVPDHYPTVPRLGFHWQLMSTLSLKGEMYYALVPGALMAGGSFKALFEEQFSVGFDIGIAGATLSGKVKAYFIIGADFIIAWQPFHYDANLYLSIGISASFSGEVKFLCFSASRTLRFDLSLGAGLHIWGPDFSGIAHVDWSVVSFDIEFGAGSKAIPSPVKWGEFKQGFLPANDSLCQLNVSNGLLRQIDNTSGPISVVEPASMTLRSNCAIPSTHYNGQHSAKSFGVAPMNVKDIKQSEHRLSITRNDSEDVSDEFIYSPITQSAPKALWGDSFETDLNGGLIDDLMTGCEISPKPHKAPDQSEDKPLSDFAYDIELRDRAFDWQASPQLEVVDEAATDTLTNAEAQQKQQQALAALGLPVDSIQLERLQQNRDEAFLVPPQTIKQQALAA